MIKVCTIINSFAPNKPGGGKSKVCLQGDQGIFFSQKVAQFRFFTFSLCRACVSLRLVNLRRGGDGRAVRRQLWLPSGHDPPENDHHQVSDLVILKYNWDKAFYSSRYLHEDEIGIPGSLRNMKQKFHHKHAGREAKVVFLSCRLMLRFTFV